ncbi:Beta-barrel assembly-enhancing protease [Acaryochloris thomasi RCC1774]|uniref:Beta-barrel assembly-enhancing protease n=1 Tax=Acaryochloris thomasi RCC1774 TaxID=1764569 RepID=A0A2W1JF56_9CYAN|nr:tetratricopeptide repeat protein [Acaryochloris thomasi]PZD72383.1 Beta-barrel assembly-enhancing protease [Acaryochloris thomasi RCC1774]
MAKNTPPTFNLLSIGHRGVGKTVFLAGSYAELQSGRQVESKDIWFEGANDQAQTTLEKLLGYMAQTGQYPPATMKVTDFTFTAKAHEGRKAKTLCEFRWADIPGEICHLDNPNFESMLLKSHGCCVFIDAGALVQDPQYLAQLEDTVKQVETISSLAAQSGLQYIFALILTKCDLLDAGPAKLIKIEQKLRSLTTRLDEANTIYRRFYSSISIIPAGGTSVVKAEGASVPILWLVSELSKVYQAQTPKNLGSGFEKTLSNAQPEPSYANNISSPGLTSNRQTGILPKVLAGVAAVGVVGGLLFGLSKLLPNSSSVIAGSSSEIGAQYEKALRENPEDTEALAKLVELHQEQEQYEPAIGYLEQLIALKPDDMNLYFQKAGLYAIMGRKDKEEASYDEILARQGNNVMALTNKAILRSTQGDLDTAKTLFAKAEASVPEGELKQTIQDVAKDWLEGTE